MVVYLVTLVARSAPLVGAALYGTWLLDHGRTADATRMALLIGALLAINFAGLKGRG